MRTLRLAPILGTLATAALLGKLEEYETREVQKALSQGKEAKAEQVQDQVNSLRFIIAEVNNTGGKNIADVVQFIDDLFGDGVRGGHGIIR